MQVTCADRRTLSQAWAVGKRPVSISPNHSLTTPLQPRHRRPSAAPRIGNHKADHLPDLDFAPPGGHAVEIFRQALALDERRSRFAPEYSRSPHHENEGHFNNLIATPDASLVNGQPGHRQPPDDRQRWETFISDIKLDPGASTSDDFAHEKECWFLGCHSDIGGGNDPNFEESLSNIPFR
jgi:hypothetical protein